ncbi:uncharacterized protein LOC133927958 [Phragmites australis]|uniref:uncharacterized protein LOC133927958 n=1 Tax=Phragmites australis TaxID=29695 RepID=UPI002D76BB42|nr:uncharacterized protein LOC133927958 [Phragmites australis]
MDPRSAWKQYMRDLCFSNDFSDEEDDLVLATLSAWHADGEASRQGLWGGSVPRHRRIHRNRLEGHNRLYNDYFADPSMYPDYIFRCRFRMKHDLYCKIVKEVEEHDPWFQQRRNAAGELGLSSLQKILLMSMRQFMCAVVEVFDDEYLRAPNEDTARLLYMNQQRGFPGMLGSIDCMHWRWKNCLTAWSGPFTSHVNALTIILEAVASQDLWIWHAFFGMSGSLNDINVLHRSHLLDNLAPGEAQYSINGHHYTMGYYLADNIYPEWATFVKSIQAHVGRKRHHFMVQQVATRKDVERAFRVL